jgi:hypothetical protein
MLRNEYAMLVVYLDICLVYPLLRNYYLSKVVHIYDVERGWSRANEHYTQQNSYIDYSIENLVKAENPKYIVCL